MTCLSTVAFDVLQSGGDALLQRLVCHHLTTQLTTTTPTHCTPLNSSSYQHIQRLYTHTHTRLTALLTIRVSQYQKGKTNLEFTWQWHQLGHMQVYTLL